MHGGCMRTPQAVATGPTTGPCLPNSRTSCALGVQSAVSGFGRGPWPQGQRTHRTPSGAHGASSDPTTCFAARGMGNPSASRTRIWCASQREEGGSLGDLRRYLCERASALRCRQRSRVLTPARARRLPFGGVARGSDMMRKKVRRALDHLRGLTNGWLRGETSVRGGLQEPQRLQALLVPARMRPRRGSGSADTGWVTRRGCSTASSRPGTTAT